MNLIKNLYKQWINFLLDLKIKRIKEKYALLFSISDGTWERFCHLQKHENLEIEKLKNNWK